MPREQQSKSQPGHKGGKLPYVPTDKDRTVVRLLCAGGITQDRVALAIGINPRTLVKHFKREIDLGQTEIDCLAVSTLVTAMRGGGKQAVAAAKFWAQTRMGWSERISVDNTRLADTPLRVVIELVGDPASVQVEQARQPRPGFNSSDYVQLVG